MELRAEFWYGTTKNAEKGKSETGARIILAGEPAKKNRPEEIVEPVRKINDWRKRLTVSSFSFSERTSLPSSPPFSSQVSWRSFSWPSWAPLSLAQPFSPQVSERAGPA